jgi:hypothetical protein
MSCSSFAAVSACVGTPAILSSGSSSSLLAALATMSETCRERSNSTNERSAGLASGPDLRVEPRENFIGSIPISGRIVSKRRVVPNSAKAPTHERACASLLTTSVPSISNRTLSMTRSSALSSNTATAANALSGRGRTASAAHPSLARGSCGAAAANSFRRG